MKTMVSMCGAAVLMSSACAAYYPTKSIRLIIPSAPGGALDIFGRLIATELSRQIGQQVVVDNRPGARGIIGFEVIAKAAPDGYTFGYQTFPFVTNPSGFTKLPYDTEKDFLPAVRQGSNAGLLTVTPSLPVKSVRELIAHARRHSGTLLFASGGNGVPSHLMTALFQHMTDTRLTHVPYKSVEQGVTDLIGGQVHLMFENIQSMGAQLRAGRVRGLALSSDKRSASFPSLPTVAESGVPNFDMTGWGGFVAPAAVSRAIVDRLNEGVNVALAAPAVREKFAVTGAIAVGGTPEAFALFIKREVIKWGTVIKDAGIKAD